LETLSSDSDLTATPVIAVTSFAMDHDRDRALATGFDHFLTKPIQPETFAEEIDTRLLDRLRGSRRVLIGVDTAQAAEDATGPDPTDTAGILVLDDSLTNQILLCSVLEPSGYRVRTAFTVEEAISVAECVRPDLVLCDVHVGGQHGGDFLSYLRAAPTLATVPFAFISSTLALHDALVDQAHVHLIRCPIEPLSLLREIETLLHAETGG
jgi:two-component system cell cycle response regulator